MQLPPRFHQTIGLLRSADLLIVMGTSLTVHPFASLTQLVPARCPRVLVNMDRAGDIGTRPDDVLLLGRTDDVVRELCAALGADWVRELDAMWAETAKYARKEGEEDGEGGEEVEVSKGTETAEKDEVAQAKALHDEVDKLTREVEKSLQIGKVPDDDSEPPAPVDVKPAATEEATAEKEPAELAGEPPAPTETAEAVQKATEAPATAEPETEEKEEDKPAEGKL